MQLTYATQLCKPQQKQPFSQQNIIAIFSTLQAAQQIAIKTLKTIEEYEHWKQTGSQRHNQSRPFATFVNANQIFSKFCGLP